MRHLREDEAVIVGVTWVFGSVPHGMKEKHRHDVCHTGTWCRVSASRGRWDGRERYGTHNKNEFRSNHTLDAKETGIDRGKMQRNLRLIWGINSCCIKGHLRFLFLLDTRHCSNVLEHVNVVEKNIIPSVRTCQSPTNQFCFFSHYCFYNQNTYQ